MWVALMVVRSESEMVEKKVAMLVDWMVEKKVAMLVDWMVVLWAGRMVVLSVERKADM
jgi:hypothetical protein